MPKVSVIILNYNGKEFLKECIDSVLDQTFKDYEILIVDNASSDGSVDFIKENYGQLRLIESKKNLGFAGGNNLGVKHAKGDLIVLLNNDTKAETNWLQGLVDAVDKDGVAIASSLILSEHIPIKYWEKKGSINFLGHNIMLIFDKEEEIFTSSGASLIFKKALINLPFDEDYFAYGEDVYLGMKARFMGYQIVHTNKSVVHHFEGGSFKKQPNHFRTYLQERNRLLNMFLFFSKRTIFKLTPLFLLNIAAKLAVSILPAGKNKISKYSFKGLVAAYFWFPLNLNLISNKRSNLKELMKVDENQIIKLMTCKLTNGESKIGRLINNISRLYFYLVRIKTIEFYKKV